MQMLHAQADLDEPVEDHHLVEVAALQLDFVLQITVVRKVHDDAHFAGLLFFEEFDEATQIRVLHMLHDFGLVDDVLALCLRQILNLVSLHN